MKYVCNISFLTKDLDNTKIAVYNTDMAYFSKDYVDIGWIIDGYDKCKIDNIMSCRKAIKRHRFNIYFYDGDNVCVKKCKMKRGW